MSDGLCTLPNDFQRLMLQWERFAPYNAGQFMTFDGPIDFDIVARAFRQTVVRLGLQQIGQHPDQPVHASAEALEPFISRELNRRFARHDSPLRPFTLTDGRSTHVGLVYRHVVADSASIRLVMRNWFDLIDRPRADKPKFEPVTLMRECVGGAWREHLLSLARELMDEVSRLSRIKHVRRLEDNDPARPVVWRRVELEPACVAGLVKYAKTRGVKVNDLFVAAAAEACDHHLPHEESHARGDLAVGTIVDTRGRGEDVHERFGLSLGVLQTIWRWQQLASWEQLLCTAASQSNAARRHGTARSSTLRLAAAVFKGRVTGASDLANFYRKRCPLSAGISNVNLTREWSARLGSLRAYTRVSPLGPMLPIVFTPTTLGESFNLGYTYRSGIVPDETAAGIVDAFIARLRSLGT